MNDICKPRTKSRKLWDKHGSWLILLVVGTLSFNGGVEWESYKNQKTIRPIIESHVLERDGLRARLREANDANRELSAKMGPAVQQAQTAAKEAGEAVNKADQTIEKANKLIEATQ